jgi:hypothetical protein
MGTHVNLGTHVNFLTLTFALLCSTPGVNRQQSNSTRSHLHRVKVASRLVTRLGPGCGLRCGYG